MSERDNYLCLATVANSKACQQRATSYGLCGTHFRKLLGHSVKRSLYDKDGNWDGTACVLCGLEWRHEDWGDEGRDISQLAVCPSKMRTRFYADLSVTELRPFLEEWLRAKGWTGSIQITLARGKIIAWSDGEDGLNKIAEEDKWLTIGRQTRGEIQKWLRNNLGVLPPQGTE